MLVVWCPDWPVVAAGSSPDEPVAVLVANRVVACSPAARAEGVRRNMRRRDTQACCPRIELLTRDPAREARRFEPVIAAVETLAPRIEIIRPGVCAVPTRGPSRYFGGDQALADRVIEVVSEVLGSSGSCRVGVADGIFAAGLASRTKTPASPGPSGVRVVEPEASPDYLAPLPITTLDRPELTEVFIRLGLRTLGELAALPRPDLLARFGTEGELAHRLACGLDERPPASRIRPPDLEVEAELDPPADRVDTAAFVAKALADDLCHRLAALGMACTQVLIEAETDHGETMERLWRHERELSAAAIADRVRWQLEGWLHGSTTTGGSAHERPTAGIIRLALIPVEVIAAKGQQLGFWGGAAAAGERAVRGLARVQGLLGSEAVTVPERCGGRTSGEQVRLVPISVVDPLERSMADDTAGRPWPGQLVGPAPARTLPEPVRVELTDGDHLPIGVNARGEIEGRPTQVSLNGRHWLEILDWAGPWPAEERWWDPATHRRRARIQATLADGSAHLLTLESGIWWLEATYD